MRESVFGGDPRVVRIVTGHFDSRPGYRVVRPAGTTSWLMTLTLAGEGRLGDHRTRPEELVVIRPGTPHDYGVPEGSTRWEFLWVHFHPMPHWAPWLGVEPVRALAVEARVQQRFGEVHLLSLDPEGEDLAMNALEEVILRTAPRRKPAYPDPRIQAVVERVRSDLGRPWTVPELARLVAMSPSRLAHLFRDQTGEPVAGYVQRIRLERARNLLETSALSVTQIAEACGYPNLYYFSLRFKQATGESPTAFRRRLTVDSRNE